jgi:hypothetical protein
MIRRITKTLLLGAMFAGIAYGSQSVCLGWSLNPFASNKSQSTVHNTSMAKKSPNALEKIGSGTKKFFNKTGETLGLKKPAPKKAPPVVAAKPREIPQPYREKKGLFSWLAPEQPRDKNVADWIKNTKQITP